MHYFFLVLFACICESKCQLSCQDTFSTIGQGLSLIDSCNDMESLSICTRTRHTIEKFLNDYNFRHGTTLKIQEMPCESHISCSMDLVSVRPSNQNSWRFVRCIRRGKIDCVNQQSLNVCKKGIQAFNTLLAENNITSDDNLFGNIQCRSSPSVFQEIPPISDQENGAAILQLSLFLWIILFCTSI